MLDVFTVADIVHSFVRTSTVLDTAKM